MTRVPQVIVTLSPQGKLQVELPGSQCTRRIVPLASGKVEDGLLRILQAQLEDQVDIGEDGAPTVQQLRHWERHATVPMANCRFCIAEGRVFYVGARAKAQIIVNRADATVRVIPKGKKGSRKCGAVVASAEDLGL
jgi:hypothetical protein